MDQFTGKVKWIYLGGDVSSETNRFHGLALERTYLAAIGEFDGNITGNFNGIPTTFTTTGQYDVFYMYMDTAGTPYDASYFGTNDNDHGDAIDFAGDLDPGALPGNRILAATGYVESGGGLGNMVNHSFITGPLAPLTGGNGHDLFISLHNTVPSTNSIIDNNLKIYENAGDDHGLDIIYTDPAANVYIPNDIIVCGEFQDTFYIPGGSTYSTSVSSEYDGFVMSVNAGLGDNWFSQEGTGFTDFESVDALVMRNAKVFATGKFQGSPTTTLLDNLSAPLSTIGLFTTKFSVAGVLDTNDMATTNFSGFNNSADICLVDTSLLTTGFIGIASNNPFYFNTPFVKTTSNHEVFIARTHYLNSNYFKRGLDKKPDELNMGAIQLFPNPNSGSFTISAEEAITGELKVFNLTGQVIYRQKFQEMNSFDIQISAASGMYFLILETKATTYKLPLIISK